MSKYDGHIFFLKIGPIFLKIPTNSLYITKMKEQIRFSKKNKSKFNILREISYNNL